MGIDKPTYVFNLDALMFGGAVLVLVILVHAVLAISIHAAYSSVSGRCLRKKQYLLAQFVFLVGMFLLMIPHLVEIGVWGAAIHYAGLVNNLHDAIVFSGSSYTTLGFAPNVFPPGWESVTIIIAVSGMFAFAWSTTVMLDMMKNFSKAREAITQEFEAREKARKRTVNERATGG